MTTTAALIAAAMLVSPADGIVHYACEGGSKMTFRIETKEIDIERPGEITISLPWAGASSAMQSWGIGRDAFGCGKAPCAVEWQRHTGDHDTHYELDVGHKVPCTRIE